MDARMMGLTLESDGAELLPGAAWVALPAIETALAALPKNRPGLRLRGTPGLARLIEADGAVGRIAAARLGADARPVRAIAFDKTIDTNWALGWHQDRTIAVAERREAPGFGPWTVKQDMQHVAPPFSLLAAMLTLRVHLDPVPIDNAPLLITRGSHRALVPEGEIDRVVAGGGAIACLADAGDVWIYATPILHASEASARPQRRRVLQIDYAARELPYGLRWLGV